MTTRQTSLLDAIKIPPNPFPGLRPFEPEESDLFFGRDEQIEKLMVKLAGNRFLAVVGTSGSGKSSLVRAGLMHALRSGMMIDAGTKWRVAIMHPSNDPIGYLARALNAPEVFGSDDTENVAIQIAVAEATLRLGSRGLIETVRQNVMPETENLLVVVDQFEELFRFAREARKAKNERFDNDAAAFVKLLLEAVKPNERGEYDANIYVALTMRSDFLGDCSQFWDLPEAINESQYLIPRLTRDQLREVIEGPVAVGAGAMAPRLVNQLLNDIGGDQDLLPILQHALMRTWNEWKQPRHEHQSSPGVIDICCYEATGRMAEALSRHADEAHNELDESHRKIAEKMFKALTERGEDNREIRRPATLAALAAVANVDEEEVKTVIGTFRHPGRSFLMPPAETPLNSDTLIDISHESLIRVWNQLQQWVNEEAESATVYRRLLETALLHKENRSELWRGADLQVGLEWQEKNHPTEAWAKRYPPAQDGTEQSHSSYETAIAFLLASEQKRLEEEVALMLSQRDEAERAKRELAQVQALAEAQTRAAETEKQRADEQARAASRLRRLTAALVVIASLAAIAAFSALLLYRKADAASRSANQQKEEAQTARNEAIEQRANAVAGEENAKIAAAEAERQKGIAENQTLIAQQQSRAANEAKAEAERQRVIADGAAFVANMNLAGSESERGNHRRLFEILDAYLPANSTGLDQDDRRSFYWYYLWRQNFRENTVTGHRAAVRSVAFSPDGRTLASASADHSIKLWDAQSRKELANLTGHRDTVFSVAFSPDGRTLASASADHSIKLWDAQSRKELATLTGHGSIVYSVAFSPDGRTLASASDYASVKLWDVQSRKELADLTGHESNVRSVAFSPDGRTLASASADKSVKLWDVQSRKELATLTGHRDAVFSVAFSPDGRTLASASQDPSVKLWDVQSRKELAHLTWHGPSVYSVAFSPDGRTLASASYNKTVKLWDVQSRKELATLTGHGSLVRSVAFSPDGRTLASASEDKSVKLWDAQSRKELVTLIGHEFDVWSVAFSPDGRMLASASNDASVKLWDVQSRKELATLTGHGSYVYSVAFSPDGRTLASASDDKLVKLWDVQSRKELATLTGHGSSVLSVAFSPDGRTLASASFDKSIMLWEGATDKDLADYGSRK